MAHTHRFTRAPSARNLLRSAAVAAAFAQAMAVAACKSQDKPVADDKPRVAATKVRERASAERAKVEPKGIAELRAKVQQFVPTEITADVSGLPKAERETLDVLIEAARFLDPIFDRQVWAGNPRLRSELSAKPTEEDKLRFDYFKIMRGPWDRQNEHFAFATERPHPPGAGYYPEDLTAEDLKAYVAKHPKDKAALEGLHTVVKWKDGVRGKDGVLVAEPYSQVYKEWLEPAAQKLEAAALRTTNASLKRFLKSRAAAFRSNDYYESDKDWMDLDSDVEVTIGPYETYEDRLLGLKAAFEAFVTVADPAAAEKLARFKQLLPAMEQNLPLDEKQKTQRGAESPIRVVDLVFSSGEARGSVQTIAFNLPNDERVRKEKGAKKVLLRNLIKAKFEKIMRPIGARVLVKEQQNRLSADAFFYEVLFHELSHSLGPAFTTGAGKPVEVRVALGASASALEEAKADVMGAFNVLYMIERGELEKELREQLLVSYFAGLFRSVRFGVAEAHGKGAALQLNRFLEEGAASVDPKGRFSVDLAKLESSIRSLVRDICVLQLGGDKAKVDTLLAKYGVSSPTIRKATESLAGIPVDVRPIYPLAGES